jgi:hypothetical protein
MTEGGKVREIFRNYTQTPNYPDPWKDEKIRMVCAGDLWAPC